MQSPIERRQPRSSWLDAYAQQLFVAKGDREIAEALLHATCALAPRGGAVYLVQGGERIAATGSGLTMPRLWESRAASNGHLVLESGDLRLVADSAPHSDESVVGETLREIIALASTTLEAIERRGEMRVRLRRLADRIEERSEQER
ncbi:MAG: hypothetical protein ACRDGE_12120 [Candidatus Limnocylindria bacterium]